MNTLSRQSGTRGFTLIEVMVAIMILALGATGTAAMQLHALRTAQQTGFQSQAVQLATDLAELLRLYGGAANATIPFDYAAAGDAAASTPSDCAGPACELALWKYRLRSHLPRARAVVCRDSAPADGTALHWPCNGAQHGPLVIKLGWSAPGDKPAPHLAPPFLALQVEE